MISRFAHLKSDAVKLRQQGVSLQNIHQTLNIPKSTLSGWFKSIVLTQKQFKKLKDNHDRALVKARTKAVIWHNQQKALRIQIAQKEAARVIESIDLKNKPIQELALAMLYLGEGFKADRELGIGNSDPLILNFFIKVCVQNFNIQRNSIKCELHLRADQASKEIKNYWSQALNLPLKNFTYVSFDKRTVGSKTYENYKGVCSLRFGNLAVQRKLMYIAKTYCVTLLKDG